MKKPIMLSLLHRVGVLLLIPGWTDSSPVGLVMFFVGLTLCLVLGFSGSKLRDSLPFRRKDYDILTRHLPPPDLNLHARDARLLLGAGFIFLVVAFALKRLTFSPAFIYHEAHRRPEPPTSKQWPAGGH